jgi:hypothetical protein
MNYLESSSTSEAELVVVVAAEDVNIHLEKLAEEQHCAVVWMETLVHVAAVAGERLNRVVVGT